ncbi:peroxide stress protein YaaA [Streptomyces sp. NPDC001595]|uniref:peroxide stress protein YaaA n=1 Tax=Streptomyces sp. NPDC001532 TaxID=3154520 RepID=UPI00332DB301
MLVLLPPSEGKASSGRGAPLKVESLSLPALTEAREAVLGELVELCAADEDKAREVLGLSEGLRGEVAKNAELRTAGARPAGEIYTGVLYDALDLASLETAAKRRAARSLLVFSGLWGAVRVTDRIPSYRCSMGVRLPGLGALGAFWRAPMAAAMPEAAGDGLVLDLRSAAYAAAWKPKGGTAGRTATVRVLHAPTRKVVSHFNKATKGRMVRALLSAGVTPSGPAELVEALRDLGYEVEAQAPAKAGQAWALDVLVDEIH